MFIIFLVKIIQEMKNCILVRKKRAKLRIGTENCCFLKQNCILVRKLGAKLYIRTEEKSNIFTYCYIKEQKIKNTPYKDVFKPIGIS